MRNILSVVGPDALKKSKKDDDKSKRSQEEVGSSLLYPTVDIIVAVLGPPVFIRMHTGIINKVDHRLTILFFILSVRKRGTTRGRTL